jgi:hypothetical protein
MNGKARTGAAVAMAVLAGAWLGAPPGYATNTKPLNISDLVRESNQIVVGHVVAVNQGIGTNRLPYTEIELKVSETIQGALAETITFRQFGLQTPLPAANGRKYVGRVVGMPQYKVGDDVVLFLGKTSPIGYRTTIGLGQGRFAVRAGNLENEFNNIGLFQNVDLGKKRLDDKEKHLVTTTQGAIGSETFLSFLRRAVNEKWWNVPPKTKTGQPGTTLPTGVKASAGVTP